MGAPDQSAVYSILIDVQAKLAELAKARAEMKGARDEGESLGSLFRTGLGIGGGMEIARRGVEFFRDAIGRAVTASSQLAAEVERADKRLGLSASGYQTLAKEARESQTDFQELLAGLNTYRQKLGDSLLDPTHGSVFRQIGVDVQTLATLPMEEQAEKVAIGLGKIADGNVRARLQQELFGRNAAAMTPVLERLRTQGLDPLRRSAQETGAILGDGMANALNQANTAAEAAQRRLTIALAPLNLQLLQMKTAGATFLANNAGSISSAAQAGFASAMAASLDKGLISAADYVAKNGGWKASFANLGKTLAGPIGVAIAVFLGSYIIKEIERSKLEANARSVAFANQAASVPHEIQAALPGVQNDDEVRALYNKAVTAQQLAMIARRQLNVLGPTNEQKEQAQALDEEIQRLNGLIPLINERGHAYAAANTAMRVDFEEIAKLKLKIFTDEQMLNLQLSGTFLTDEEKRQKEIAFLDRKIDRLAKISALTARLPLPTGQTEADRAKQLAEMDADREAARGRSSSLRLPLSEGASASRNYDTYRSGKNSQGGALLSPGDGITAGLQNWSSQLGSIGQQIEGTVGGALNSVSGSLTNIITKTGTWGDLGRSVGLMLLQTLVQVGLQMAVNAALDAAGVTGHVAGESAKTAATAGGTAARSGLHITETVVHGVQVGLRVAAHLAGEILQTGITIVQAGLRIASVIAESAVYLVKAAIGALSALASIPYVGPILAIAAMAAVFSAGSKLLKREQGGPVRAGQPYLVGEKRPEVFVPTHDGNIVPSVDQYRVSTGRSGLGGSAMAGSMASGQLAAQSGRPTRFIHVQAPDAMSARRMARDPDFDNVMLDWSQRNRGEALAT